MSTTTTASQREQNLASIKSTLLPTTTSRSASQMPIIDAHIHLYPASEASTLAWLPEDAEAVAAHPLAGQHSLDEYADATTGPEGTGTGTGTALEGFVLVEADRQHDLASGLQDGSGWAGPLMEVDWQRRVALGTPRAGEGHSAAQAALCLAVVAWAPLPSGPTGMERYVRAVQERAGPSFAKIRAFRYLVQDKPRGTMLTADFIESLRWMGTRGYVFDVGVDHHRQGDWVLQEAVEMIGRAHEGVAEENRVAFVLDHLCKPDLTIADEDVSSNVGFQTWREAIFTLSRCSKTYVKLSGCFSEMADALPTASGDDIFMAIQPWLAVILATFGPSRIMFASDWPVCTGGPGDEAWRKWRQVVQRMCELADLGLPEQIMIWSGTAIRAYGIEELL
ncbi:MAG: hypothetical protein M1818_006438 [Claussenomyces sp. TS43310]|nr:MAG: hypothetical protein M1818_006438 [Claussenomyces sp. TS43310]